jgi:hypothetical protein
MTKAESPAKGVKARRRTRSRIDGGLVMHALSTAHGLYSELLDVGLDTDGEPDTDLAMSMCSQIVSLLTQIVSGPVRAPSSRVKPKPAKRKARR